MKGWGGDFEEKDNVVHDIRKAIENTPEILMVNLGIEGWAFILKESAEKTLKELEESFLKELKAILENYKQIEYFGGMGKAVERLSELNKCFEEASHAFAYRYLKERNQIIYSDALTEQLYIKEEPELGSLEVKKLDRRVAERFLKTGLKSEVADFVEEYFLSFGEKIYSPFYSGDMLRWICILLHWHYWRSLVMKQRF